MQVRGCEVLFTCGVVPASAGSYTKPADKPAFQWTASPSTASDTAGAISFDAPHPGFIETGGQVSYAYFYVDGEWRSIIAVPPAATTVH